MSKRKKCRIAIVGLGQRGSAYLSLCEKHPGVELVALCDSNAERLRYFAGRHGYGKVPLRADLDAMATEIEIDGLVVTAPDFAHKEVALTALRHGLNIMLEKPMAPTAADCREIIAAWRRSGALIQIGFVLRAHPFYRELKKLIDAGAVGELMSVAADESLGVAHGASYMRRWHRKSANSGGFLLAKCSHDLDLLSWLAGARPRRVASFGSLGFFLPEKRKANYCSECADADCRFRFRGEMVVMTDRERANPSEGGFDLCVFNDDKDVVDRQVVTMEFANGVCATFSLNLFAKTGKRSIKITGSDGQIEGDTETMTLRVSNSRTGTAETRDCRAANASGHGGSDLLFFNEFIDRVQSGEEPRANAFDGLAATVIANAIERSRLEGRVVAIAPEEYK